MKKIMRILMLVAAMLIMTGCVTDDTYAVGKAIYIPVKGVIKANPDLLSDETLESLKELDAAATTYDITRTQVREIIDVKPDE